MLYSKCHSGTEICRELQEENISINCQALYNSIMFKHVFLLTKTKESCVNVFPKHNYVLLIPYNVCGCSYSLAYNYACMVYICI